MGLATPEHQKMGRLSQNEASPTSVAALLMEPPSKLLLPQQRHQEKRRSRPPGVWLLPFLALSVVAYALMQQAAPMPPAPPTPPCALPACTSWAPFGCFKEPACGSRPADKLRGFGDSLLARLNSG